MCGRVIRTSPVEVLFDLTSVPDALPDRYNLAPTDPIPVIRYPRELELLRWGLEMPNARMAGINARVESLSKPLYREKLRDKRCFRHEQGAPDRCPSCSSYQVDLVYRIDPEADDPCTTFSVCSRCGWEALTPT